MRRPADALATLAALLGVAVLAASPAPARADNASTFRDTIPRYGGNSDFDPEDEDYQMSIALLAIVPLVFAVGTLIACVVACCCKTLCRCCCRRDNDENGPPQFTKKQRWVPLVALGVLAVGCMAFSAAGIAESGKLTDTLLAKPENENDTETLSVRTLVPNSILRVRRRVAKVRSPVEGVEVAFDSVVDTVSALLLGISSDLGLGLGDLSAALDDFGTEYRAVPGLNASDSPDGKAWSCVSCGQVSDRIAEASADLGTAATDTVQEMNSVNDNFRAEIAGEREGVMSNVRDLEKTLRDADDDLSNAENTTDEIIENLEKYDPARHTATVALFAVPIVALALAFVGALLRVGTCFKVNMWTYFLVVFLCWVMFAVHLPLAVLLSDSCAYVEEYETETVRVKGAVANASLTEDPDETRAYQAAVACLDDLSLVEKLGYSDELDFAELVPRPTFGNVSEQFDLDGIAELGQLVADMTTNSTASFAFVYALEVDAKWETLKADGTLTNPGLVTSAATFLSYSSADSTNATLVDEVKDSVNRSVQTHELLLAQLSNMTDEYNALVAKQNEVRDRTVASADTVSNVTAQLGPLFDLVEELIGEARCPEAGEAYEDAKALFCDDVSRHLTTIAMSLFFVAFLGWFVIWLSAKNAKRWPNKAAKVIDADEDYDGMPMKKLDSTPASPRSANPPPSYSAGAPPPSAPVYNANPQEGGAQY